MNDREVLSLEDERFAAMVARDFKFAAWQSCPQPQA